MRPHPALLATILGCALLVAPPQGASAQQSQNITLLATQNLHSQYTGSWPYIHTDGREYVALGTSTGTAIVRLTDPANPVEVAFIPGVTAGVREMEQYQTYLYSIGRGGSGGIQVISMADPDNPVLVNTVLTTTGAENVTIDTARGYLYTSESFPFTTIPGIHIYSLADPATPVRIGVYEAFSVHDLTVKGTRGYACDQDLDQVHILDLTNPATPTEIVSFASAIGSTHTAWPTTDDRYLIVSDEQFAFQPLGRPLIYDIQNLNRISLVYSFDDLPQAMPHFPMVRGNLLYVAHYTAGVHVYDISDPLRPVKVSFYDTWAGDDGLFDGVYEAPPFYPSGIFTASDMTSGLYVFRINPNYGLVRGTVRVGSKALAGATVRVLPDGPSTVTGANGVYGLAPASGGTVTIECSKFGYGTQSATISVTAGSEQTSDFTLSALGTGTVKGTVRRASDQTVIAGADVSLVGTPVAVTTSGTGKYTMMKVPAGAYTLRAETNALGPVFVSAAVASHATTTVDVALAAPPFFDDAETDRGWSLADLDDDAIAGRWVRTAPTETSQFGVTFQPGEDHSPAPGTICFVTGNAPAGSPPTQESLRGGKTTLTSPPLDLTGVPDPRISYWLWFYSVHYFPVVRATVTTQLSNDGGLSWIPVSTFMLGRTPWVRIEVRVQDYIATPGSAVRIRFVAENRSISTNAVEVLIDDVKVFAGPSGGARVENASAGPLADQITRPALGLRLRGPAPSHGASIWDLTLSGPGTVRADLFDVRGRLVRSLRNETMPAGDHSIRWDGELASGVPAGSGVYWIRVRAGSDEKVMKFVVTR